ncbi:YsnF/AvaK domain-containing protein [Streptomyces sp. NPDC058989]|uniref:YsnF/AvaK domain-containing protein n=1 Tax=Streptomyces sp. NPDC058989 TaxID=3346686 RepID=UPI00367F9F3F
MNAPVGDSPQSLTGLRVVDVDGVKVGTVQQVYRDDATNDPEWITVRTGLFGMKETFIPLAGARRTGDELRVPHTKDTIKEAPGIDADGHLDPSEEARLYRHYGLMRPDDPSDDGGLEGVADDRARADTVVASGLGPRPAAGAAGARTRSMADTTAHTPARGERNKLFDRPPAGAGAATRGRDAADARPGGEPAAELVLSEERLEIGTEERVTGRVHLSKHVVTEEVHRTVPVTHEEVRVVREKITEEDRRAGRAAPRTGHGRSEVVLHEEQPTISRKMVPVERVWLETERVTEQKEITTEIHREEVEIDDGTGPRKDTGPGRPR